jgi:hypothetical protein
LLALVLELVPEWVVELRFSGGCEDAHVEVEADSVKPLPRRRRRRSLVAAVGKACLWPDDSVARL